MNNRVKEGSGWRQGRPVEDPEKTKRWGIVSAKPSEYLVHVRSGRVLERSSGQGAWCFKWPWDATAIVPTSLQRLSFRADQVTAEKVGVEVVGLAVYRIAEPLIAYRVLNFSYPERAQEKLEETLTGMFVGSARRLIANLSVEDCLRRRKSALGVELLREIAPIVGGEGRLEDGTDRGWGLVIDSIEVQEVRILSEKVFADLQAPYRADLELELAERRIAHQAKIEAGEAQKARDAAERVTRDALLELERASRQAKAEIEAHELALERIERQALLSEREQTLAAARRTREAEIALIEGRAQSEIGRLLAEVTRLENDAAARLVLAQKLPELASAVGQKFGEIRLTQIGDNASPFATVAQAVSAIVDLAKTA